VTSWVEVALARVVVEHTLLAAPEEGSPVTGLPVGVDLVTPLVHRQGRRVGVKDLG